MKTEFWSVDIPAPPEQVFPYLWDTVLLEKWVAAYRGAQYRFPAEPRMERTAVTSIKLKGGWRFAAECNKVELNREVAHKFVEGPFVGTERWVLEPTGSGSTRMSKILTYAIKGPFDRLMWRLVGRATHSRITRQQLATLRELIAGPG